MDPWVITARNVALILLAAGIAFLAVRLAINAAVAGVLERRGRQAEGPMSPVELERRVRTLQRLAMRIAGSVIVVIAALMILEEFTIDIGPAVAGLGVAGIAVGLGAQTLVKDWLAGIFIVLENQYSAGDRVRIAGVEGEVEDFSLRRTTLRDADGTVHTVPNGQIIVASNLSRGRGGAKAGFAVPEGGSSEPPEAPTGQ
jgi:small conductance mechanosensitive channel